MLSCKAQLGGGELTYVVGSDMRSDSGGSIVADGNTSLVLEQIKAAGLCKQTMWDFHTVPSAQGYNSSAGLQLNLRAFSVLIYDAE